MRNESLPCNTRGVLLYGLLVLPLACGAAPASAQAPAPAATADSLARIENETLLLKAQERQMAVRLVLATQRNDLAQRHAETRSLERPARAGDPTVVAVEGIGSHPSVTLVMDNGSQFDAAIGDVLPNGMTVLSVRAGEVVVGRGRAERIRLSHAAPAAPTVPAASMPGPAPGAAPAAARAPWTLPPLPAMPATAAGTLAVQGAPK